MRTAFVITLLALVAAANAQRNSLSDSAKSSQSFSRMEFGIHAGPGISTFYNQHPLQSPRNPQKSPYGGALVGFSYLYHFTPIVGLQMEANWERKGDLWYDVASWSENGAFTHSYAYENINYLTLPVTLKLNFGKTVKFFTNTGLYGGVLINAYRVSSDNTRVPGSELSVSQVRTVTDVSSDLRQLDGGVVMGLGISFPLGRFAAFSFEARDNLGLVNLNKGSGLYGNHFYNNNANFIFGLHMLMDKQGKNANLRYKTQ